MEDLRYAPSTACDENDRPRYGKYRGALSMPKWPDQGSIAETFHHKRWCFLSASGPQALIGAAVVELGYGGHAFLYAVDLEEGRFLAEGSVLAMPWHIRAVGEAAWARFDGGGLRLDVQDGIGRLTGENGDLKVDVRLELRQHEPLAVIAPVEGRAGNYTYKRAGVPCKGALRMGKKRFELTMAGTDYTDGFPPRHTTWRWAMANGWMPDGAPFGLNLVEGFNEADGIDESALWVDGNLINLGPARFTPEAEGRWTIETSCGGLRLRFEPTCVHQEKQNLLVVRSNFRQQVGTFKVRLEGMEEPFELIGVVEDQDVLW